SHDGSPLQNVSIHNRSALTLGGLHLTGDLLASTGGQLTQTGALITGGAASFTAGAGTSLNLGNAGNDFGGAVSFASAGVTPLQDITVHSQSQLQLGTLALAGNLLASTSGQLTQSGAAGVGGSAGFTAGVGQSIVLDQAGNQFSGAVSFASAGAGALQNVSISSVSSLQLTGGELAGDLQVHSMGAVTQTGALRVAGAAAFFGGAGESVTLTQV